MKYSIVILILIYLTNLSFAQNSGWVKVENETNAQLNKIFFIDTETGWAVGDEVILKSGDGGSSWTVQDFSNIFFRSLYFTDSNHGWAVGFLKDSNDGIMYQSQDGGLSWQAKDTTEQELIDIYFVDADTGYICGGTSRDAFILKTTDHGTTWHGNLDESFGSLYAIHFSNHQHGCAVGKQGLVLTTENSGKSWDRVVPNLDVGYTYLYDVQLVDQETGWCLGGSYIFESGNGGKNWELRSDLSLLVYAAVHFYDTDTGWLLGSDKEYFTIDMIFSTSDGSASWQVQDSVITGSLQSLFFIDDKVGWVVGTNGIILKTTNGGITSVSNPESGITQFNLGKNYPNPFNPITIINYELPITNKVNLTIYDLFGQRVVTLVSEEMKAGHHQVIWDASGFASGVYYYCMSTDAGYVQTKKLVLLK